MHDHGRLPIDLSHIGQRSGPTAARSVEAHLRKHRPAGPTLGVAQIRVKISRSRYQALATSS